jgi:hypothetical protein
VSPRAVDRETPDRVYTVTRGRTIGDDDPFDLVSLIVSECDPVPGMQSEHAQILRTCSSPTAVVELASDLDLPVSAVKVLLLDLLDSGRITIRRPRPSSAAVPGPGGMHLPDRDILRKVLVGLQEL